MTQLSGFTPDYKNPFHAKIRSQSSCIRQGPTVWSQWAEIAVGGAGRGRQSGAARKGWRALVVLEAPVAGGREQAFLNMSHSSAKHLYIGDNPFKISQECRNSSSYNKNNKIKPQPIFRAFKQLT